MKIRLYFDEDAMQTDVVKGPRARGVDVVTAQEAQMRGRSDEEQLRYATEHGRVIYSFNTRHFMALNTSFMEQGLSHTGIVLTARKRWPIGEQLRRLSILIKDVSAEEMVNRVEFLSSWG
jgi:predicted RNA methylase